MKSLMAAVATVGAVAATALPHSASAAAPPDRYLNRLAHGALAAGTDGNCLVLRSTELCGYRVRLLRRARLLEVEYGGCRWGGCWFEYAGYTAAAGFFCRGWVAWYPRLRRWMADQSMGCYADNDASWYFWDGPDGPVVREP